MTTLGAKANLASLTSLIYYPIKGLSGHSLARCDLRPGLGIPGDRAFALLFASPAETQATQNTRRIPWAFKSRFAVQNDWPALASLHCQWDPKSLQLRIANKDSRKDSSKDRDQYLLDVSLANEAGLAAADAFFSDFIRLCRPTAKARHPDPSPLQLVGGEGCRYPDREVFDVSLMSRSSLAALAAAHGKPIDIGRFRGNLIVDGWAPWYEGELLGQTLRIGNAVVQIKEKIARCHNINVDTKTGHDDDDVLRTLGRSPGHGTFGVIANVLEPGDIKVGDRLLPHS